MNKIENAINSKFFSVFIVFLIFVSIGTFSIETLPDLPKEAERLIDYIDGFIVVVFTIEYLIRIYIAKDKLRFISSFHGVIDLLAILPFYLTFALDLRALRLLRMLRLLRILKLARYNKALSRMGMALSQAKEELVISIACILIVIYLAAFGIYQFEHTAQPDKFVSIFDALWWAVATITTVGYGDIFPITVMGRVFAFVVMIAGIGLIAVPTGIFSSALLSIKSPERKSISEDGDDYT